MSSRRVYTVLAVDDEEAVLSLLKHQLSSLPYVIIPTLSPAEAIQVLQTREIAVLICDLNMPGIDGNTVLNIARETNPNIVSILLTGRMDITATIKAINEGGIWKYISKPWNGQELIDIVREGITRYVRLSTQQSELATLAREVTAYDEDDMAVTRSGRTGTNGQTRTGRRPRKKDRIGPPGFVSSRYHLDEVLGEGGMGTVYLAEDRLLGMPVAIKVLGSNFTKDEIAVTTLKEEARIAMQLSHRHIVRIHNLHRVSNYYFLVMEYVQGRTLRQILHIYGQLPLKTVLQIARVSADALSYAHRHGVLHRDLKPANLMLAEDGVLKIIDFGIACLMGKSDVRTGHVIGTPIYMSPEQIRGESLDHRTDIYALGIIIYQLLTGNTPFPEDTTDLDLLASGPGALSDLPDEIRWVVEKAVSPYPRERWDSVEDFATALMETSVPLLPAEQQSI